MFGWVRQCTAGKDRADLASEEQGLHCNFILQCRICTFICVKEKFLGQKTNTRMSPSAEAKLLTAVFFCDTEGLWNVLAKTESSFPNEPPPKLVNFFRAGEWGPNFKFYCFLFSER